MSDSPISRRSFMAVGASLLALRARADAVEAVADAYALHIKADGRPVFDFRLRASGAERRASGRISFAPGTCIRYSRRTAES